MPVKQSRPIEEGVSREREKPGEGKEASVGEKRRAQGGQRGVRDCGTASGETGSGVSFCSPSNGMERGCLSELRRVVPHQSTYKSGPVRQHALEERELGGAMGGDEEEEDHIKAAGMRALFRVEFHSLGKTRGKRHWVLCLDSETPRSSGGGGCVAVREAPLSHPSSLRSITPFDPQKKEKSTTHKRTNANASVQQEKPRRGL
ncbi:hypothetical protein EYF80_010491 [Liparis tanakae]|uniref:Uncharacterized protein n=1 Tax=Liparis tanakae TaxID=230148 RepID=A0A4Z2IMZ0_9TELE|nr:hypothetical protein EYF80_010491 [Liparis tanakae]